MKTLVLLCCLFLLLVTSPSITHAAIGYVITEEISSPIGTEKRVTYVTDTGLRGEEKGEVTIISVKGSEVKLYKLDPVSNTAKDDSELAPLLAFGYILFLDCGEDGESCKEKKDFITPPKKEEHSTIGGKRARKMLVNTAFGTSTQWYTKDWKELIEADRARMKLFVGSLYKVAGGPMIPFKKDVVMGIADRISNEYGASLKSETSLMGFSAVTKVLSVEKKDLSGDLFRPPANYKVVKQEIGGIKEEDDDNKPAKPRRR